MKCLEGGCGNEHGAGFNLKFGCAFTPEGSSACLHNSAHSGSNSATIERHSQLSAVTSSFLLSSPPFRKKLKIHAITSKRSISCISDTIAEIPKP